MTTVIKTLWPIARQSKMILTCTSSGLCHTLPLFVVCLAQPCASIGWCRTHTNPFQSMSVVFSLPAFFFLFLYFLLFQCCFPGFEKPWFHVTPQSGNLRKCVLMSFYFPAPVHREAWGLPAFSVTYVNCRS